MNVSQRMSRASAISLFVSASLALPAGADTLTVCGSVPGSCDYDSLQIAVQAADPGDLILVEDLTPHEYNENIAPTVNDLEIRAIVPGAPSIAWGPGVQQARLLSVNTISGFRMVGMTVKGGQQGGVIISNASPTFEACRFLDNFHIFPGAGVEMSNGSPQFLDCLFEDNITAADGGAVELGPVASGGVLTRFQRCLFKNNSASFDGGAIFTEQLTAGAEIVDCIFQGNRAATEPFFPSCPDGSYFGGGAIFDGSQTTGILISGCTFKGNSSGMVGGALFTSSSFPQIAFSLFETNFSECMGGAAFSAGPGQPTFLTTTFGGEGKGNRGQTYGGAVADVDGSQPIYSDCSFIQNSSSLSGGAAFMKRSGATYSDCLFVENGFADFETDRGGAIAKINGFPGAGFDSEGIVERCVFSRNFASDLGGAVFSGQWDSFGEPATGAAVNGGIIVTESLFTENGIDDSGSFTQRTGSGGAIAADRARVQSYRNEFYYNETDGNGAAFFADTASQLTEVVGCMMARNRAVSGTGAGIYVVDGPLACGSNTVARNVAGSNAAGAGIYIDDPMQTSPVVNSIVWNNTGSTQLDAGATSFVSAENCDISGTVGNGWVDMGGNLKVLPKFVAVASDNFHLKEVSPLRNKGDNTLMPQELTDIDGQARILDGTIDMGADEVQLSNAGSGQTTP